MNKFLFLFMIVWDKLRINKASKYFLLKLNIDIDSETALIDTTNKF